MKKLVEMNVKGFTLVEMLVVWGIISLLLLLFVP
ncbi:prepilin-type N-terminal cleavage/methylation domain-containing protein, partial [Streptococcus suis]